MASKTDLAWAAGFLDGEGSFLLSDYRKTYRATGHRYNYFRISASQKHDGVLKRLVAIVGGRVYGPYKEKYSSSFHWQVDSYEAKNAYSLLRPYLSCLKRRQADHALRRLEIRTIETVRLYRRRKTL